MSACQGWLYLAILIDLCSPKVVGWVLSDTPDTALIKRALTRALPQRHASAQLMFHSDQGCKGQFNRSLQHTGTGFVAHHGPSWQLL